MHAHTHVGEASCPRARPFQHPKHSKLELLQSRRDYVLESHRSMDRHRGLSGQMRVMGTLRSSHHSMKTNWRLVGWAKAPVLLRENVRLEPGVRVLLVRGRECNWKRSTRSVSRRRRCSTILQPEDNRLCLTFEIHFALTRHRIQYTRHWLSRKQTTRNPKHHDK